MSLKDEKKGSVDSLDEKAGVQKKGEDAVGNESDKPKCDADAMGHVTGGEAKDGEGNIDSFQSSKPVPRDALKVNIPGSAQQEGLGNVAQPGHDNAKKEEGEDNEDVDGEEADEDEED